MNATLLLLIMVALLMAGIPAAVSLGFSGVLFFAFQRGIESLPYGLIAQRVMYGIDSFPLLAIPLFLLMGEIMNRSGTTTRIYKFCNSLVGHFRGGLGHVNIVASMFFAGMSGSATADAAALGPIQIKAMTDAGYEKDYSTGLAMASSLIGPIIPPSIPVILYAILAEVSVSSLLIAGIVPGIMMALSMMALTAYYSHRRRYPTRKRASFRELWADFRGAFYSILTPLILIGGIISGFFTATEAAAIAVVYALVLSLVVYRSLTWRDLIDIFRKVTVNSAAIMFILSGASLFSWILTRARVPMMAAEMVTSLTTNKYLFLGIVIVFLLIVGCFMAVSVAINVLAPILAPIAAIVGVDPIQFGIIVIVTLVIGEATPPFGMVLYVITKISDVPFSKAVRASISYLLAILAVVIAISVFEPLTTFLPAIITGR